MLINVKELYIMKSIRQFFIICIILSVLCLAGIAEAQIPDRITEMRLDESQIFLDPGKTYTFRPVFYTEAVNGCIPIGLHIFSADENVVKPGTDLNSIIAVGGGETEVTVFSHNFEFQSVCTVTVSGEPSETVNQKAGEAWEQPPAEQLAKINDPTLKAYFEMLGKPSMTNAAADLAKAKTFKTLVNVPEGRAASLAKAIEKIGMDPVYAFELIDTISVTGTPEQYLILLRSESVLSIDEDKVEFAQAGERSMLEGQAEAISHFSKAYDLGFDGSDTAVAIIDTGIYAGHEQFPSGKIIDQRCYSNAPDNETPSCMNGQKVDTTSAGIGSQIVHPENFRHGTHVAAIAAGKDGVAPNAKILAFNVFVEYTEPCKKDGVETTCYFVGNYISDQILSMQYLLSILDNSNNIKGQGVRLAAVNLSIGGNPYDGVCQKDEREPYLAALLKHNVIPVVAAGNYHKDGMVTDPACAPSAFTVGALWDSGTPEVADYSNHSKLVDILAPGTQIYSAIEGTNSYDAWNGTSMAAPMVSGTAALLRQKYDYMTAEQLESMLVKMSTKQAERNKLSKPVLDLTQLEDIDRYFNMNEQKYLSVYGGNKLIQIDFSALPFITNYSIQVFPLNDAGRRVSPTKPLKELSNLKNLKTVKISGLTNNTVYEIDIHCDVMVGDDKVSWISTVMGMPMTSVSSPAFKWAKKSASQAKLQMSGNAAGGELFVEWHSDDARGTWISGQEAPAVAYNMLYTAEFYKKQTKNGVDFYSVPVQLQTVPVAAPEVITSFAANGKFWIKFKPVENVISREIQIYQQSPEKLLKKLTVNAIADPADVLISGLKNGVNYKITVKNSVKIGGKIYKGLQYTLKNINPVDISWDPKDYKGQTELFNSDIKPFRGVTLTAGNGKAVLRYEENLVLDGYRFQIKPVIPNLKKTELDVPLATARNSYTFTDLKNGNLYKLRFLAYMKTGKLTMLTGYYPGYSLGDEDNSWDGILFVPLPEAEVTEITPTASEINITVKKNDAAKGFAVVLFSADASVSPSMYYKDWTAGSNETLVTIEDVDASYLTAGVMLYQYYEGQYFYGPSVMFGDVIMNNFGNGTGPKSAGNIDLWSVPELADAAQIDGMVVTHGLPEAKSPEKNAPDVIGSPAADEFEISIENGFIEDEITDGTDAENGEDPEMIQKAMEDETAGSSEITFEFTEYGENGGSDPAVQDETGDDEEEDVYDENEDDEDEIDEHPEIILVDLSAEAPAEKSSEMKSVEGSIEGSIEESSEEDYGWSIFDLFPL